VPNLTFDQDGAAVMIWPGMTVSSKTYTVAPVDLARADDVLHETLALANAMAAERIPEDPPISFEAFAARVRNRPAMVVIKDWLARSAEGELVARGLVVRFEADANRHLREANIEVLPPHRRSGLAKRLLREISAGAGEADDIVLAFYVSDRVPAAAAFVKPVGAKTTLTMHTNQLDLSRLDRAMVREWAAINTKGYRLAWIEGDVPDDLMANVIVAYDAMNTAPRGDSAMQDWNTTPEQLREFDRARRGAGRDRRLVLAIHEATGQTAGYTELVYDPKIPHLIWQQGTAVIPSHRGRGLGKWVKGATLDSVLRDWPAARLVRTGNADSNAPMLAINTRLGFKSAWARSPSSSARSGSARSWASSPGSPPRARARARRPPVASHSLVPRRRSREAVRGATRILARGASLRPLGRAFGWSGNPAGRGRPCRRWSTRPRPRTDRPSDRSPGRAARRSCQERTDPAPPAA
jgi:GNAT superfamily N-acetyltransferase